MEENHLFNNGDVVVIDSLGYVEEKVELWFWLYEQAMLEECRIIFGGCPDSGEATKIFEQ